jgi:hypothetical protein
LADIIRDVVAACIQAHIFVHRMPSPDNVIPHQTRDCKAIPEGAYLIIGHACLEVRLGQPQTLAMAPCSIFAAFK